MKNLFITGGSGTVGKAFIENNIDKYNIFSFSRNEKAQVSLKRNFPQIQKWFLKRKKLEILLLIQKKFLKTINLELLTHLQLLTGI